MASVKNLYVKMARKFQRRYTYHCIAMKAFMILPAIVLQKSSSKIKSSEYSDLLNKSMGCWRDHDFTSLIRQARTIQSQVNKKIYRKKKPDTARVFVNLMFEGKVSVAIRSCVMRIIGVFWN